MNESAPLPEIQNEAAPAEPAPKKVTFNKSMMKDWTNIPVPEYPWHGSMCPDQLKSMREAARLPYHPKEPHDRATARAFLKKAPREFHSIMARLEKELSDRADREEERERQEKAVKTEEKKVEEAIAVKDLGYEKVVELGKRLLDEMDKALEKT